MENPKKQAPPITAFILRRIHKVLDFKSKFELTMWALFLTSFFLMLRKSNVTPALERDGGKILKRMILSGELAVTWSILDALKPCRIIARFWNTPFCLMREIFCVQSPLWTECFM